MSRQDNKILVQDYKKYMEGFDETVLTDHSLKHLHPGCFFCVLKFEKYFVSNDYAAFNCLLNKLIKRYEFIREDNGGCLPVLETGGRRFESCFSDLMREWRNGIRV